MNFFEANVSRLALSDSALAAAIRQSGGGTLEILPARTGMPSARANGRWIHSAYDPIKEAQAWAESQSYQDGETLIVFGMGLLYHVEALCARLPRAAPVVLVVSDLSIIADAAAARTWGDWIERVSWAWGTTAAISEQIAAAGHPLRLVTYAPAAALHADDHRAIEMALQRRVSAQASGQLRIAVVGPIYGGSLPITRYAVSALESLGHDVRWLDHSIHATSYHQLELLKNSQHRLALQSKYAEMLSRITMAQLAEDPPDLVLSLAQAPLILPALEHLRRKRFLTAIWFVENYRHLTYWQQLAAGYDFWFVIQQEPCIAALKQAGAKEVRYLPMAADLSVHRPLELTQTEREEYGSDVSFVGAGYANRREIFPRLLGHDWTFKLWGNEWDGATELTSVLQRNGARIDTDTCQKVFNASAVNLNLHSWAGTGLDPDGDFVNPRTFELAACGAFQLTDRRSLMADLFTEREVATVSSSDELPAKIARWLREPAQRVAMAAQARQRVLAEHTYAHRMRELLSQIGVASSDRIGAILRGARQAEALAATATDSFPSLASTLRTFPSTQRVELKQLAAQIRSRGPMGTLSREDLMVLMLDEYRSETKDLV
ncbi:MAG: glycosyltransferase [Nitrospirae bacterium]|nr:glycosyltransferase [Nitrospirota bacterium]